MKTPLKTRVSLSANAHEQAATFFTGDCALRGILTQPQAAGKTAAVFAHGWSGVRGGPSRLFVSLACAMAADGIPSLRFDFRGRGESQGNGLEASLRTMAEDLEAAVAFMRRETGCSRILLVGICSGANVCIGSLDRLKDSGIAGLLLLSAYPFSDGDSFGRAAGRTWHYARIYGHKLRSGATWRRLLRGDIDLRSIVNVLFGHFAPSKSPKANAAPHADTAAGNSSAAATAEGRFQQAPPTTQLNKLGPAMPGLMLYGTADPDAAAAQKYYESYARKHDLPIRFNSVSGADHNFSSLSWHRELLPLARAFWQRLESASLPPSSHCH